MPLPDQSDVFKKYRDGLPRHIPGLLLKLKLYSVFEVLRYIAQNKARIMEGQDALRVDQAVVLLQQMHPFISEQPKIRGTIDSLLHEFEAASKVEAPATPREEPGASSWNSYTPSADDASFIRGLPPRLSVLLTEQNLTTRHEILGYIRKNSAKIRAGQDALSKINAVLLLKRIRPFLGQFESLEQLRLSLIRELSAPDPDPAPTGSSPSPDAGKPAKAQPVASRKHPMQRASDEELAQILKNTNLPSQYKDACPVCHVVYRLDNLAKHIATGHGMKVVNCKYCGSRVDAGNLANHLLRKHHGELGDVYIPPVSRVNPHIQVPTEPPPAADGPADTYEFFCRAMPADVLERLQAQGIDSIYALLAFMDDHKTEICQNKGLFLTDEAVLMLRRMISLGVIDPRVTYLLRDVITSVKYKVGDLRKPRRFKCACPACGKMYAIEWLQRHVGLEHTREMMQCPFCTRKLGTQSLCNHLSERHHDKLLSVYAPTSPDPPAPACRSTEEESGSMIENWPAAPRSAFQAAVPAHDPKLASSAHSIPAPRAVPTHSRPAGLREFRLLARARQAKTLKIPSDIGDRTYFVSQASRVKTERANRVHESILASLREHLENAGMDVGETFLIDAYADISGPNIFEIKSIDGHNEKNQIRHAVAQLYEYRFVYGLKEARLWLVLSGRPESGWILEYLVQDRGIHVLWLEDGCLRGPSLGALTQLLQPDGRPRN